VEVYRVAVLDLGAAEEPRPHPAPVQPVAELVLLPPVAGERRVETLAREELPRQRQRREPEAALAERRALAEARGAGLEPPAPVGLERGRDALVGHDEPADPRSRRRGLRG